MMDTAKYNEQFRAINILFMGLVGGILMFMGVSAIVILTKGPLQPEAGLKRTLFIIVGVLVTICVLAAFSSYNKKIAQIDSAAGSAEQRIEMYRAALIAFLALCELPALFAVISFLLTGDYLFLLSGSLMLAVMFSKRPHKDRIAEIVKL